MWWITGFTGVKILEYYELSDWQKHKRLDHCHLGLPCNPSCHEFQEYQGCQPGPLQWKRDIYMTKWFEYCHAPINQKVALPLTQEFQGNLVLPTMAKVAHRWKMKENKGKQLLKKDFTNSGEKFMQPWENYRGKRCQIIQNRNLTPGLFQ